MEVVLITNTRCHICTRRITYPTREEERKARLPHEGPVADHVEYVYDCRAERPRGERIIMYLHGRYSKTIVQIAKFWLESRDPFETSGTEAWVARHQTPWPFDIRYLMGCDDNPRDSRSELKTGFEPGIIRIGKSLRWKARNGLSGTTLLPIAHLIIGFTPMD
ncbi:MAG: hypothetical protein NUW08_02030 [Candidatus Uhrbacteria bacterium]|nr:hypothetical protein [Candidatus Uhrbacteria bacterium]